MQQNEPKQIPGSGEYTGAWSHQEIKNAFEGLNTHNSYSAAVQYSNAATAWDQGVETFARSVISSISQAWEGPAADAAKDALKRYTDDARKLEPTLTQLSNNINDSAGAIVDTRNAIPGYADHSWTANIWPPRAAEEERSRNDAEHGARDAMNNIYVTRFSGYDAQVPVLPVGVNPTQPLDVSTPGPGTNPSIDTGGNPSNPANPGTSSNPTGTADPNDKDGDGKPDQPSTQDKRADQLTSLQNPANPQTAPSGYNPTTTDPSTPHPGEQPKTVPSSTTSGTSHTPGLGVPVGPESRTAAPGRSMPGTPSPSSNPTAVAAAAASRSANGMPGMAPGMGGAGRGKSDEESTHKIPEYLINQANTDELLGETPRTLPGGLIGVDPEYAEDEHTSADSADQSTDI
ncbi:hypothetical protein OG203_11040 [Nocardia sp. NBC_01499]|uniref:hypothetical protein n=1 Tax=Nocardia sp. NBC_01499 TaxID=2903597 RepID=UPI00386D4492